MVYVLHGEADEHEPGYHEGRGDVAGQEAGFRVEPPVVPMHVERGERVVQIAPDYFAEDGGGDGGELEEAWGFWFRKEKAG